MAGTTQKTGVRKLVAELTDKYYDNLNHAHENGKLVAWASSIIPQEFLEAMDIEVAYPENHAAAVAARRAAPDLLAHAEAAGYNNDICAYARVNMAYADVLTSPAEDMPRPDFVICTNNICNVVIKWYENLAHIFNVPMILIDTPYNYEYEAHEESLDYIVAQFQTLIEQLEIICQRPFNYEKFDKVMEISHRAAKSWWKAMSYCEKVPSPMDGFNMFNYMALAVCMRGKEEAVELFDALADEMEQFVAEGKSQVRYEEKYRIEWNGIACWPHLAHTVKTLAKEGAVMVGSLYPEAWALFYEPGDLRGLAKVYSENLNNCCTERQSASQARILRDCHCDGTVYHMNRSCKIMDFSQANIRRMAAEKTGLPYTIFDGDQADPKNFAEAQYDTRIQALVETMAAHKGKEAH